MNGTTLVLGVCITLCGGSLAMGVATRGDEPAIPWDKITGGSALGAAIAVGYIFLKRDEKVRAEHEAARQKQSETHAATIQEVTEKFGETATGISRNFADAAKTFTETVKAQDERAERREERIAELFKGLKQQ